MKKSAFVHYNREPIFGFDFEQHKDIHVSDTKTHWMLLWIIILVAGFGLLILTQMKRLHDYDRWYACMYQGWNYERCNTQIYGD